MILYSLEVGDCKCYKGKTSYTRNYFYL